MFNGIWEIVRPANRKKKTRGKTANAINMLFYKYLKNPLGELLKRFSKLH